MTIANTIPDFRTPASTGQTLEWSAYRDKAKVVLAFLAGEEEDLAELRAFDDFHAQFGRRTVQVLAVAPMTASETRALAEERDRPPGGRLRRRASPDHRRLRRVGEPAGPRRPARSRRPRRADPRGRDLGGNGVTRVASATPGIHRPPTRNLE